MSTCTFNSLHTNVTGSLYLYGNSHVTNISGIVYDLDGGYHGFHIHEFGDLGDNCKAAGGHFNPHQHEHGGPNNQVTGLRTERHIGDLGNVYTNVTNGLTTIDIEDNLALLEGEHSIVGRAIVIHEGKDDLGEGGTAESL